ncbi:MAG: site-specific DNA-methyltransferase, partial [Chloroflexota bacterium]
DNAKLSELLADMNQNGINLKAVGWDHDRLDALLAEVKASVEPTPDNHMDTEPEMDKGEELKEKWDVSQGDIWALGDHRLICGDCTEATNINRLMNGEQIVMVMTSPPYAAQRDYEIGDFDWDQLMNGASSQWFRHMKPDGNALINLGLIYGNRRPMLYWEDWLQFCDTQLGWPLFGLYVWDKLSGLPGDWNGRLAPSFEFVFHFNNQRGIVNKWVEKKEESIIAKNPERTALRNKDGTVKKMTTPEASLSPTKIPDDVIRIHREYVRDIHTEVHPAVYPVAFPVYLIQTWTRTSDIVYEPFLGSGTTLMAAEQLGRRCYGCELEPKYVAVALERWHMATEKMPMRLE